MNSPRVVLEGYILVPEVDLWIVESELAIHIETTRQEPGCEVFEVTKDDKNPFRFNVYEVFQNQAAFSAHQERVRLSRWGEVSVNVARHYRINGMES